MYCNVVWQAFHHIRVRPSRTPSHLPLASVSDKRLPAPLGEVMEGVIASQHAQAASETLQGG